MSTGILIALVVVAALACPLMMWWQSRRGRAAVCCVPARPSEKSGEVEALRARQERLAAQIAELETREGSNQAMERISGTTRS